MYAKKKLNCSLNLTIFRIVTGYDEISNKQNEERFLINFYRLLIDLISNMGVSITWRWKKELYC